MNAEVSRRATYEQIAKSGHAVPELKGPALPPQGEHLWRTFLALSAVRGSNGFGPNPLTPRALLDWQELMRARLSPFDGEVILALDGIWFEALHTDKAQETPC